MKENKLEQEAEEKKKRRKEEEGMNGEPSRKSKRLDLTNRSLMDLIVINIGGELTQ